ncbi:hypothetical protein [Nostoc favosum]|uniref:hypothetical protein n=1 Tax=Nostoc favosum TaxID=2907819 RepID=UPI003F689F87
MFIQIVINGGGIQWHIWMYFTPAISNLLGQISLSPSKTALKTVAVPKARPSLRQ